MILVCSSLDISKNTPINDVARVTCHSEKRLWKTLIIGEVQ